MDNQKETNEKDVELKNNNKPKKKNNAIIVILVIVVIILTLVVGVQFGLLVSKNQSNNNESATKVEENNVVEQNKKDDEEENIENNTSTNKTTNKTEQTASNTNNKEYANEYKKIIENVQKEYSNQDLTYDLVYFNNDNIPDLVVGLQGYWVSLYMYKNGSVKEIVDEWPYGAMGNVGYDYLEKKGAIMNYNSDYAGAIRTKSILVLNNNNKFDTLSVTDKGADVPESDPSYQEIMKTLEQVKGYYFNDKKITEEEYNNKLKEFSISSNESDYKELYGTKTSAEIQKQLQ